MQTLDALLDDEFSDARILEAMQSEEYVGARTAAKRMALKKFKKRLSKIQDASALARVCDKRVRKVLNVHLKRAELLENNLVQRAVVSDERVLAVHAAARAEQDDLRARRAEELQRLLGASDDELCAAHFERLLRAKAYRAQRKKTTQKQ